MTTQTALKPSSIPFFKVACRNWDDALDALDDAALTFLRAATLSVENDGIGAYECHGYKGFDRGHDYPVYDDHDLLLFEVHPLRQLDSPDELRVTLDHDLAPVKLRVRYELLKRYGFTALVLATITQEDI